MDEITADASSPMETLPTLEAASESLPSDAILAADEPFTSSTQSTNTIVSDVLTSTETVTTTSDSISTTETFTTTTSSVVESSDLPSEEMSCDVSEEAQNEDDPITDDPSVAIDQFIKKIADEQLSAKRSVPEDLPKIDEEIINEKDPEPEPEPEPEPAPVEEAEKSDELIQETEKAEKIADIVEDNETKSEVLPLPVDKPHEELPTVDAEVSSEVKNEEDVVKKEEKEEFDEQDKPPSKEPEVIDLESVILPSEIAKDPVLIAKAQEEIKKTDVLICGTCHNAFHFIEEFQEHKTSPCIEKSCLVPQCENESKPQVWGFTLWKVKQTRSLKDGETPPSSWTIYQRWCKLPQLDKNAWITAGQTIQFCSKIGSAKVTEVKAKMGNQLQLKPVTEQDPLAIDFDSNKENSESTDEKNSAASDLVKRGIIKPVKLNNDVTIIPSSKVDLNSNKAIRTTKILSTQKQEYAVEKIVAKRFNPRRKIWEYQIKWENFPSESNTWEPVSNLNHCKQMLEKFEEQLKKIKEEKAKQLTASALAKNRGRPQKSPTQQYSPRAIVPRPSPSSSSTDLNSTPGRPQRSSKQKALNQVKAWCGNMSDNEEGGVKRPFEDDDSDDSFEKRMKFEEYSDDSDVDVKPKISIKKLPQKPQQQQIQPALQVKQVIKNGVGSGGQQILPQNILIPDANGVVRINQKQLPSLSTGVYIMSKTAGIIKLDSSTSKVATSGGQTIVKVAPKIGQTQIRIVKKDGGLTKQIIQVSPKTASQTPSKAIAAAPQKTYNKSTSKPKKIETPKIIVKPKEDVKYDPPFDEDSDDGIEPLEFPTDLPLPPPESPPREFVLDPFTGKIAGKEYPEEEIKQENDDSSTATSELENIVKLAAADITEEDLKSEAMETEDIPVSTEDIPVPKTIAQPVKTVVKPGGLVTTRIIHTTRPTVPKSEPSILNKALTGSNILQKSLLGTPNRPRIQQRVLNQSVATKSHISTTPTIRPLTQSAGMMRTRPIPPRPKFNLTRQPASKVQHSIAKVSPSNKVQVYSNKPNNMPITRKIGNTFIRSTSAGSTLQKQPTKIVQTMVYKTSPKKESLLVHSSPEKAVAQIKPKTIISMPSLSGDDEPMSSLTTEAKMIPSGLATSPVKVVKKASELVTPATLESSGEGGVCIASVEVDKPAPESVETPEATTDLSSFTLTDNENPIFITGDDGTVYQVAGQNEQGQTILITQGADGQQQCLLVTNEVAENATDPETATTEAETAIPDMESSATDIKEPLEIKTDTEGDSTDQVVAQVVRAEPPSPGGTHKVVVMLPDGNLMVTQVSPEEYASLELE